MGRDWSWLGGGGGGKKKSSSKSKKEDFKPPPSPPSLAGNTATAAGCMSAVFNIFDFQHLQFPINHHHLHLPKGTHLFSHFFYLFYITLFDPLLYIKFRSRCTEKQLGINGGDRGGNSIFTNQKRWKFKYLCK